MRRIYNIFANKQSYTGIAHNAASISIEFNKRRYKTGIHSTDRVSKHQIKKWM